MERVVFVSGVSGGSVTAAYFGLKGRAALADFRERFLIRNAEEDLSTSVNLRNIAQGLGGGVNDASKLSGWLDRNLFDHATPTQRTGNYLKSNNNFASDRCTVAELEESVSPRVGINPDDRLALLR